MNLNVFTPKSDILYLRFEFFCCLLAENSIIYMIIKTCYTYSDIIVQANVGEVSK